MEKRKHIYDRCDSPPQTLRCGRKPLISQLQILYHRPQEYRRFSARRDAMIERQVKWQACIPGQTQAARRCLVIDIVWGERSKYREYESEGCCHGFGTSAQKVAAFSKELNVI